MARIALNTPTLDRIPLPNDKLPIYEGGTPIEATVVASCFYYDDNRGNAYTLLLLVPEPPYYLVVVVEPIGATTQIPDEPAPYKGHEVTYAIGAPNIVPAVHEYEQAGGDW